MSAPHRGLPPPAAMTIAHQSPSQGGPPPTTQPSVGPAAAVPAVATVPAAHDPSQISHAHVQAHTRSLHETSQLPPPPPWPQHGAGEEVMRAWLVARAEEDKRRAEQERTLQENIRLEQRRTEHEMLRTSLNGGIPPPMVPIVFAGMAGGSLPQATLEWAHQFMFPHGPPPPGHIMQASSQLQMQQQQHQHLITAGASSALAEHQRRSSQVHMLQQPQPHGPPQQSPQQQQPQQMYGLPYGGGGGGPGGGGSAVGQAPPQGSPYVTQNPASPLRTRGYSLTGPPRIIGHGVPPVSASLESTMSHPLSQQQQQQPQQQPQQHQPDAQASPLYIHHWQPPTSQAASGGSAQAASALAESPRKRKATGPPSGTAVPPSTQPRFRSPNFSNSTTASISNPPPGRRRGHTRQRSDVSSYRPQGRGGYSQGSGSGGSGSGSGGGGGGGHSRGMSPSSYPSAPPSTGSVREADEGGATRGQHPSVLPSTSLPPPPLPSQSRSGGSGGCHPVSSLLSDEPSNPYGSGDSDRHRSPRPGGHAADNKGSSSGGNREGID